MTIEEINNRIPRPPAPLSPNQYQGTALSSEPIRVRGSPHLPPSLTLDRAPALAQLCAGETDRQQGKTKPGVGAAGGGSRMSQRGGRFRHYLVRTGVVGHHREADTVGRMYQEPAW